MTEQAIIKRMCRIKENDMEIYKKIFGKYEVSNLGNVRNSNTGKILKPIEER